MAASRQELLLTVPAEMTLKSPGLAIDMGSSVIKFVYRTKDDLDEARSSDNKFGRLRLVTFGRHELQEALEYVKQRAEISAEGNGDEQTTLHVTGNGTVQYGKIISQKLNVRLQNVAEFDCFIKSFIYLTSRLSRHQLLEPFDTDALTEPIDFAKKQLMAFMAAQSTKTSQAFNVDVAASMMESLRMTTGRSPADDVRPPTETALADDETDLFPCLLAMCGSGISFLKVERNGSFQLVDAHFRGAKSFVGLGFLLTDCKTFDELIELASKGDQSNVDQYSLDMFESENMLDDEGSNMYKQRYEAGGGWTFCFGKATDRRRDTFAREDLARAWLRYTANDLASCAYSICQIHETRRLFFCGGFCSHPLVRHVVTAEMSRRNMMAHRISKCCKPLTFDFLKPGHHMGALGCIVQGMEKSLDK